MSESADFCKVQIISGLVDLVNNELYDNSENLKGKVIRT